MAPAKFIIAAVDGSAASGKSSTSRAVAERLNLLHVDSGAHYRAVTLLYLKSHRKSGNSESITDYLTRIPVEVALVGRNARIRLNHYLPTGEELRTLEVTAMVSHFAAMPKVREILLKYQRSHEQTARDNGFAGMIMEGRDIGTVVFPNADFKFFLSASPGKRAERRAKEGLEDSIAKRDKMDSGRKVAPLACAPDAIRIDSSYLSLEAVVNKVCAIIEGRDA